MKKQRELGTWPLRVFCLMFGGFLTWAGLYGFGIFGLLALVLGMAMSRKFPK
jgi:hypothetical protein